MSSVMLVVVKVVVGLYLFVGLMLYLFQRTFIYYPTPALSHGYEERVITHQGERLRVIVMNAGREKAILYFGGNGESMVSTAKHIENKFPEYTVYLPNYRGYGGSSGSPTQEGLFADAVALYDSFSQEHKEMAVMGRSLGSGIALYLSTQRDVQKVALVTPYESVVALAQERFPLYPMSLLLKDKYDVLSFVSEVHIQKLLILLAEEDRMIGAVHSDRLIAALPFRGLEVKRLAGTGHNSISQSGEYDEILERFFTEVYRDRFSL